MLVLGFLATMASNGAYPAESARSICITTKKINTNNFDCNSI